MDSHSQDIGPSYMLLLLSHDMVGIITGDQVGLGLWIGWLVLDLRNRARLWLQLSRLCRLRTVMLARLLVKFEVTKHITGA